MRHPSEGVLRRLVDEPAGVTDDDRAHVAGCPTCLRALDAARADARLVDAALATSGAVDIDAAWARLSTATAAARPRRRSRRRPQPVAAGAAPSRVAALSAVVLVTGAGVAAANDWLPIFRTEQVDPIEVTSADLVALPDLSAYGDVEVTEEPDPQQVADAGAARERTGLAVPEVAELPRGRDRGPGLPGGRRRERARSRSRPTRPRRPRPPRGEALPPPPAGLDGSSLRLAGRPGRRRGLVAAHGRADPRRRPRRRADGRLLRRPVRDGARLPAVPPRPARRPRGPAARPLRGRRHAAPARARPSW